jgi:hypothetical protein
MSRNRCGKGDMAETITNTRWERAKARVERDLDISGDALKPSPRMFQCCMGKRPMNYSEQ